MADAACKREKTFLRKIAAMKDKALIALHAKLSKEKDSDNGGKRKWWVIGREICFASLELLDRGYVPESKTQWIKQ
jgi:hypothetical protein